MITIHAITDFSLFKGNQDNKQKILFDLNIKRGKNMNEAIQLILFIVLLAVLSPLLGKYMAKVFMGEKHIMKPVFGWLEKLVYQGIRYQKRRGNELEDLYVWCSPFQPVWFCAFVSFADVSGISAAEHRKIAQCFMASCI